MRRVLAYVAGAMVCCASPALAQAQENDQGSGEGIVQGHPTETMQQSQNQGQINGVPATRPHYLTKEHDGQWLAAELLGAAVINASNERVGEIDDLVINEKGRLVGVIIGVGGFLGIGEKDVGIKSDDIRLSRQGDGSVRVMANLTKGTLTAAPAYRRLDHGHDGVAQ